MTERSIKGLLPFLNGIVALETRAKEAYEGYLQKLGDERIVEKLSRIRDDEAQHIEIARKLIPLVKYEDYYTIIKVLESVKSDSAVLLHCSLAKYRGTRLSAVKYLVDDRGLDCIYVTVNKPSKVIAETLKKEGVDVNKIRFIDLAPVDLGDFQKTVVKPENPTELSLAIESLLFPDSVGQFVFFDTISTYFLFHESAVVDKFALFLAQKLRAKKVGFIPIAVREEIDGRSLARLTLICDKKIDIT